ncbi:GGDEF domain-containing protein [Desulfocurvus sp. DL9XJH121]
MPEKSDEIPIIQSEGLLQELSAMRALLREHSCNGGHEGTLLGLLRLCPGLNMDDWPALRDRHGLRDWLALPVQGQDYPLLSQIQETLQSMAYQSEHDPLTGLANRRVFDSALEQELERAHRQGESLSLAMFDLDNFKSVNDTHGHPTGDVVLTSFADVLTSRIRRYDLAARLGGEEFAVLFPGTGQIKAVATVERILQEVRGLRFTAPANGSEFSVTCSAGLACYKGYAPGPAPDMVQAADEALYRAKSQGKDRVLTAPLADTRKPSRASLVESNEKKFLFTGTGIEDE